MIVFIGLLFSLLSIAILTLSIYLLLQKNIDKLKTLVFIGYTPRYVALPYILMTVVLNLSVWTLSVIAVSFAQDVYMGYLSDVFGVELASSPIVSIVIGLSIAVVVILFNTWIIQHKIKQILRN